MSEDVLPDGWALGTVADLCRVVGGGTPSTKEERYWNGDVPWITSADILDVSDVRPRRAISREAIEHSATNLVPAGSVIVVTRVGLGKVALVPMPLCFSQDSQALVFDHTVLDPMYLAYYLKQAVQVFRRIGRGTTISGVTTKQLRELNIRLPPFGEQRRIVQKIEELFTKLDAAVAALERCRANLKRYRAAVLEAAVEGKLTELWQAGHPNVEPAGDLLERILDGRRQKWEEAELARYAKAGTTLPKNWRSRYKEPGEPDTNGLPGLPGGWCWTTVSALVVEPLCNGISVKGSDVPPGVPALRLSAMSDSGFDYDDRRYIPISGAIASSLAIRETDFFVARGNGSLALVGRGTLAQAVPERVVFPDTMIRLRFAQASPLREYINTAWRTRLLRGQIERKARTTAGIYKISQPDIEGLVLPLPPLAEQAELVKAVDQRLSMISSAESQVERGLQRARLLRQSVLKRAFEGKLVPQDPADEPASALLERVTAMGRSTGHKDNARRSARKLRAAAHQPSLFDEAAFVRKTAT